MTCADHERYTEDHEVGAAYLDMFPCNDTAAVKTIAVTDNVNIDVRADTGEIAGIELLDLDAPLAKWLARAADALARLSAASVSTTSVGTATVYVADSSKYILMQ